MPHRSALSGTTTTPTLAGNLKGLTPAHLAAVAFLARYTGGTHDLYRRHLGSWLAWCETQGLDPLADVARVHVELYIRELVEKGLKASTIGSVLTPVRGFYRMSFLDGLIERDPSAYIRLPKVQHAHKAPFDRDDMRRLLAGARDCGPRHYALAVMLSMLGMRISEACSVDVPDIFNVEQGYRVLRYIGKGAKPAATPIPYQAIPVLEAAAAGRQVGPLLLRRDGVTRLDRRNGAAMINTAAKHAGMSRHVNPHLLRAGAVTLALDTGLDLREVQDFARHEDPRTTRKHYDLSKNDFGRHASHTIGARLAV